MTVQPPESATIAIVGGGIIGSSLAWHLARRGVRGVVLFERSTIAAGASGRTGALLRRHYTNRLEATLAQASFEVFQDWDELIGGSCGYDPTGLVVPIPAAADQQNLDRLHRNIALQRSVGIDTYVITAADLLDLEPHARVDDIAAAAYEPASGYVDAVAATRSMAEAAIREGAQIVEGCPILGIATDGDRVTGLHTSLDTIAVNTVVCAAGPWSTTLLTPIGVQVPLTALRVQVAVVNRPLQLEQPHRSYVDPAAGMFCRPYGRGRTLVGLGGGDQHDRTDPDSYIEGNSPDYPALAIEAISRRMPGMAAASYSYGWAGLYDMTPDGHPILGQGGPVGLYLALGFSGAGFKKGPAVGQCLSELILDGRTSLVDLAPFRLSRFETDAWRDPWSDSEYVFTSDFGHGF